MNDAAGRVDHLSAIRLEVHADRCDPAAVNQHVARREIGNVGVHRYDGAALEEGDGSFGCSLVKSFRYG